MSTSPRAEGRARLPGVILDTGSGLRFVHAENALVALDDPRLSPLPGTRLELLWFEGHVVVAAAFPLLTGALDVGPQRVRRGAPFRKSGVERSALVCELAGQRMALTGVELVSSGRFELVSAEGEPLEQPEGERTHVRFGEHVVEAVDLAALLAAASALAEGSPLADSARSSSEPPADAVPPGADEGPFETRDGARDPGDIDPSHIRPDETK